MYSVHFGISESPFALTPDPRFLFLSRRHQEALAHLLYGMGEKGGFVQLTGEVGTGKTTLCRSLLEQVPDRVNVALILNPKLTAIELVASVCDELHVSYPSGTDSLKALIDLLNYSLLETHSKGLRTVLIIDEAQNLSSEALEQVRLLTNLETTTKKLLQIILIGQPELQTLMARPELRQLAQRITARYHLTPLSFEESGAYILHRLEVVGCKRHLFTRSSLRLVHKLSGGIPRLINVICDRAMLGAYVRQDERISKSLVRKAAREVMGKTEGVNRRRFLWWSIAALVLALIGYGWGVMPWSDLSGRIKMSDKPAEETVVPLVVAPPLAKQPLKEQRPLNKSIILAEILNREDVATDIETAFSNLFCYWELPWQDLAGNTACDLAAASGLRCLFSRGNWMTLLNFNRPAVLELIDDSQQRHHVVLAGLNEKDVIIDLGDQRITLARADVEHLWFGDFIILWKPPLPISHFLGQGSIGPDVLWLREQLDRIDGRSDGTKEDISSPLFDEILERRVMDFQRRHSINADGKVGEETLIQLNTALGVSSIPLLYPVNQ